MARFSVPCHPALSSCSTIRLDAPAPTEAAKSAMTSSNNGLLIVLEMFHTVAPSGLDEPGDVYRTRLRLASSLKLQDRAGRNSPLFAVISTKFASLISLRASIRRHLLLSKKRFGFALLRVWQRCKTPRRR